jgi:glycosyltransferase involved in cell wall biosynthesis
MERLVQRGHNVRIIDFDILWRKNANRTLISHRSVISSAPKVISDARITVIRPAIVQIPVLDYISLLISHRNEIHKQFDEFKPDIVIGLGILNAQIAIRQCHKKRIPFVYYVIDELHRLVPQTTFQRIARSIEKLNYLTADLVLSINEGLREYTIAMGAQREKTKVVRTGVNMKLFSNVNRKKKRDELGLVDNDIVLFFMGWLYEFSGLKEVTDALITQYKNSNFKLLIVGNGDLWEYLQNIKTLPGMAEKIISVGWQPYHLIPDYLAAADICLLPARKNEIMKNIVPIKMYEYMAAGKPVIATNLYGIKKEFGFDNGVIYIDKPEEAVKKAYELFHTNTLSEHGVRSRHFVEPNTWNVIADKFEKVLEFGIDKHHYKFSNLLIH